MREIGTMWQICVSTRKPCYSFAQEWVIFGIFAQVSRGFDVEWQSLLLVLTPTPSPKKLCASFRGKARKEGTHISYFWGGGISATEGRVSLLFQPLIQ